MNPDLLFLDDPLATDASRVGQKAARLAVLLQAGYPVPHGFVIPVGREPTSALLAAAYGQLAGGDPAPLVAVRSSATTEDLPDASFAGIQETVLGVRGVAALEEAVGRVSASLDGHAARAYRARAGIAAGGMAVLVQRQVAATVAGVAFARDPVSGEPLTVVEAVAGVGEGVASGEADPQRWRVAPDPFRLHAAPPEPLLPEAVLRALVALVARLGAQLGGAQDVEWAWDRATLWLLQARPITTQRSGWFTATDPADEALWTAAFLNERFTQPVSPLGWSLVAGPLARLALRGPLELLGAAEMEGPLLKLWRGHPYSRVAAWQRIYKLFPAPLLPEDAARYFPAGDVSLRHAPRVPVWGPQLLWSGLRVLADNFHAASPLHNPAAWDRYEQRQAACLIRFHFEARQLAGLPDPIPAARSLLRRVAALTDLLLELHRWSLLYADLSYSLLRRVLQALHGVEQGGEWAVRYTGHVESVTTRMNQRLAALAQEVRAYPLGEGEEGAAFLRLLAREPVLAAEVDTFLRRYGHRFFSLDLYDPPWEADRAAFGRFLLSLGSAPPPPRGEVVEAPLWLRPLVRLASRYLALREVQRFRWQQLLALQRYIFLRMGTWWAKQGELTAAEHIFGMSWEEVLAAERPDRVLAALRMEELERLRAQARQAAAWHYPAFLRGNEPVAEQEAGDHLVGQPVSPGMARGPARLIADPAELARLRPGDILVTRSPDPGWTPIFGTIAGLVTAHGGQLSHGAVVAREYALPAVAGVAGVLTILQEGEPLLVDGTRGIVLRLQER